MLENAFFFFLIGYFCKNMFYVKILESGPSERWHFFSWNRSYNIKKSRFILISKLQICLGNKMLQKSENKKTFLRHKFSNFPFSNFNFKRFGSIGSRKGCFFKISIKILDFIPFFTYSSRKKFSPFITIIFHVLDTKTDAHKRTQKCLFCNSLRYPFFIKKCSLKCQHFKLMHPMLSTHICN
jgi:hypothetical protein